MNETSVSSISTDLSIDKSIPIFIHWLLRVSTKGFPKTEVSSFSK